MAADPWGELTWDDITEWAGEGSVKRGKSYHSGRRVSKLARTADGGLLADVRGTFKYVTHATLRNGVLHSECTCPVGQRCKHAVATILTYLDALKAKTPVPVASENDARWAKLAQAGEDSEDDEWYEDESGEDDEDEGDAAREREALGRIGSRGGVARPSDLKRARAAPAKKPAGKTAGKPPTVSQYLAARTEAELRDLLAKFAREVPAVRKALEENAALSTGDVALLVKEARAELRKQTRRDAYRDDWDYRGGGGGPEYQPLRRLFEKLLDLEAFDDLVALGRELFEDGTRQIEMSDDEGELHGAIMDCLAVAWKALARSSRPVADKFVLLEELAAADEFDLLEYPDELADASLSAADWSSVADALVKLIPAKPTGPEYSQYRRNRQVDAAVNALDHAGRADEATALCEREAPLTHSYVRLVDRLLAANKVAEAEKWIAAGVVATQSKLPGIAKELLDRNRDLALKRKDYPAVAAHAAEEFFEWPSVAKFDDLLKAAAKAKCEPAVRVGAMKFLETGDRPRPAVAKKAGKSAGEWPLPPAPQADTRRPHREGVPHFSVLIDLALRDDKPAEALAWYDKWVGKTSYGVHNGYAERIAAAVQDIAPERSLAIYKAQALALIERSDYDGAKAPLRRVRDLYVRMGKPAEWTGFETDLRVKYPRRRNLMPVLDSLAGKPKKLIDG